MTPPNMITPADEIVTPAEASARLDRRRAVQLLWQARRFLWRWFLASAAIAVVIAFLLPSRYKSTTRIMPSNASSSSSMMMRALGATGSKLGVLADAAASASVPGLDLGSDSPKFIAMLESRTVADRLIDRFHLMKEYGTNHYEETRKILAGRTVVAEDRRSGVISITVTDRDPLQATAMARAYTDELSRLMAGLNTSSAHRERVFLETRTAEVKKQLDASAVLLSQFSSNTAMLSPEEQAKKMVDAAVDIQSQIVAADSQLRALEQVYTSNNVRLRQARARVTELKRELLQLRGPAETPPGAAPPKPTAAAPALGADTSSAADDSNNIFPSIRSLPSLGVAYFDLYRRAKILEMVYETLTRELEMAKVDEVKQLPEFRVMDPPDVPEFRSFPPRKWVVLLLVAFGMLVGAGVVLGRDLWLRLDPEHPWKRAANLFWQHPYSQKIRLSRWSRHFFHRNGDSPFA